MKKKKTQKIKYPPLRIVGILSFSMIGGLIASAVGIAGIQNYVHPYYFGFLFGGLGLLAGVFISKRVKSYFAAYPKIKNNYRSVLAYISIGLIGFLLLVGNFINQSLSHIDRKDRFEVINKYKQEKQFRVPGINSLVVNIDGKPYRKFVMMNSGIM